MTKNGCWNREPLRDTAIVQAGWHYGFNHDGQCHTRMPAMIEIPDPMSKHCQYQRDKKDDPKCKGCRWLENRIVIAKHKFQYYYSNNECKAMTAQDEDCICWHDQGTGPYKYLEPNSVHGTVREWRVINVQPGDTLNAGSFEGKYHGRSN